MELAHPRDYFEEFGINGELLGGLKYSLFDLNRWIGNHLLQLREKLVGLFRPEEGARQGCSWRRWNHVRLLTSVHHRERDRVAQKETYSS